MVSCKPGRANPRRTRLLYLQNLSLIRLQNAPWWSVKDGPICWKP